ncbi:DUF4992 family lipoprotein [Mangrovibacterium sp.]|uniref:DUF4992 family lipoprotein n=1 Tax=Mangrovibacterium sp. TaxID=1961364 RepID=UPI003563D365
MNDNNFRSPFEGKRKSLKFISSIWPGGISLLKLKPGVFYLVAVVLFLSACAKGFDDEWTFTPGVENATLESPNAENVQFIPSADGSTVKIVWPVVYGAGGYQFSLYIVDDPTNQVVVGAENEFVDGASVSRELLEDTKYKVVLKTLGNEKYNNKEATSSTDVSFNTLLEATIIPDGTDLTQYFIENPIVDTGVELGYELEAGGTYTVSGEINFGTAFVTLRGNKINRATVTMNAGFKSQGGGTKFKFINFECANIPTDGMFFGFTDIPGGATIVSDAAIVTNPIVFQSCNFIDLPVPLYWDNGMSYAVQTLLIKDVVAEIIDDGRVIRNSASAGYVKDFKIENSTVYKNNTGTDYFMQMSTSKRAPNDFADLGWATASFTYSNCTFYGFDRMHNSNRYTYGWVYTTVKNCIFLEMLRDQTARYILPGNRVYSAPAITFDNNTYWRLGAVENYGSYDKSGKTLDEDPLCANPAGGDFTVGNPNTVSRTIGDPRWF